MLCNLYLGKKRREKDHLKKKRVSGHPVLFKIALILRVTGQGRDPSAVRVREPEEPNSRRITLSVEPASGWFEIHCPTPLGTSPQVPASRWPVQQ